MKKQTDNQRNGIRSCRLSGKCIWGILLFVLICVIPSAGMVTAAAGETEEKAQWTVLFYLCGSDLESRYSYATENLGEIMECRYPDSYYNNIAQSNGMELSPETMTEPGKVNVLIETGGCSEWHCQDLGMQIANDRLQRWSYDVYPDGHFGEEPQDGFTLVEELPLQSMADPETLTDFIRWGCEQYPAKKTAVVLWDHGGGSKSGLFIDELHEGDTLYLYELEGALKEAGTKLDLVLFDACLMANIETAWTIREYADWMVASEEVVPGGGTAVSGWLQELYNRPDVGGSELGRWICDMTQVKYGRSEDEQANSLLTWSLIDLGRIDQVGAALHAFTQEMHDILREYPLLVETYAGYINRAEEFGDGNQGMKDIASLFYDPFTVHTMDRALRSLILSTLSEAVVYCVRGAGRTSSRGLSFCYAVDFSPEELDVYAKNCQDHNYLAFLDAVSPWSAPDYIYEDTQRLPEISTIPEFQITVEKKTGSDGMPGIQVVSEGNSVGSILFSLLRKNEETGQTVRLGRTTCLIDESEEEGVWWTAGGLSRWPCIEGQPCETDYLYQTESEAVFGIPVLIDSQTGSLRCGRTEADGAQDEHTYRVYGLWEGDAAETLMPSRSVKDLSRIAGREYQLLYTLPEPDAQGHTGYETGGVLTMYRVLDVEELPLPAGTYYLEYEVEDVFMHRYTMDRIELYWDGSNVTYPDGFSWEGTVTLTK